MSIRLDQVSVHQGGTALLNDCSLLVGAGQRCVLLGPEGSGKGTLLRAIAGFCRVDHGRILLEGQDVTRVPARLRRVGLVPRQPALFMRMSVRENIGFALAARRQDDSTRQQRVDELLRVSGLESVAGLHPGQLSPGEVYRTAIGRCLGGDARVLLLEDACAGHAYDEWEALRRLLETARARFNATVLMTTTEPAAALRLGEVIGVMGAGKVLESGDPESLYLYPRSRIAALSMGPANLIAGHRELQGLRIGHAVYPHSEPGQGAGAGGDVVVLVRPEDVLVTPVAPDAAGVTAGTGIIQRLEQAAQVERIYVACHRPLELATSADDTALLMACRPAALARQEPLVLGQAVAVDFRRVHCLATQLCSLWFQAEAGLAASGSGRSRWIQALSAGMQVAPRPIEGAGRGASVPATALCVVPGWGMRAMDAALEVLERGSRQVLLVRDPDRLPQQMWIVSQPSRAARDRLLAVSASLLRYLPMEATLLVPALQRLPVGRRYRVLLDLRRRGMERHGVDLRTEYLHGELAAALKAKVGHGPGRLCLAIGAASPRAVRRMAGQLDELVSGAPAVTAVLLTTARREESGTTEAAEASPAHGCLAVA